MKKYLIIAFIIIIILVGFVYCYIEFKNSNNIIIDDPKAINISELFTINLLNANENSLEFSTGEVKNNIKSNIKDLEKFDIINIKSKVEYSSGSFAITNVIVEYETNNDVDVVFYRFYLVRENNEYLIYKIENDFSFANFMLNEDIIGELEIKKNELFTTIEDYMKDLEQGELILSSRYLIGKAKQNHDKSYQFINRAKEQIKIDISNIKHEVLIENSNKISVVKSTYTNDNRLISILTTLYKTSKGWRIYDISGI